MGSDNDEPIIHSQYHGADDLMLQGARALAPTCLDSSHTLTGLIYSYIYSVVKCRFEKYRCLSQDFTATFCWWLTFSIVLLHSETKCMSTIQMIKNRWKWYAYSWLWEAYKRYKSLKQTNYQEIYTYKSPLFKKCSPLKCVQQCRTVPIFHTTSEVGVIKSIPPVLLCFRLSKPLKLCLPIEYHIHFSQTPPQLSCYDDFQI